MWALFKLEGETVHLSPSDPLCPMIRLSNTYDAEGRIRMELGAFRFVCTNLSVGGGGFFAEGCLAQHLGWMDIRAIASSMADTLSAFPKLVLLFRTFQEMEWTNERETLVFRNLADIPGCHRDQITAGWNIGKVRHVWNAYNVATDYATHRARTVNVAYSLLAQINRAFAEILPEDGRAGLEKRGRLVNPVTA